MALCAAQVIDALAARLAGVSLSAGRVYTSRLWPITEAELPAWRLTAQDEAVTRAYISPGVNEHRLSIEAQGIVRATADADDRMHDLAEAGLAALFASPSIYNLQLDSIGRDVSTDGESSVATVTLLVSATFAADQSAPGTFI